MIGTDSSVVVIWKKNNWRCDLCRMNKFITFFDLLFQVNLKSARLLRPGNTLQKQIGMANLSKNFESELSSFQLVASKPPSRLEYNQVTLGPNLT